MVLVSPVDIKRVTAPLDTAADAPAAALPKMRKVNVRPSVNPFVQSDEVLEVTTFVEPIFKYGEIVALEVPATISTRTVTLKHLLVKRLLAGRVSSAVKS